LCGGDFSGMQDTEIHNYVGGTTLGYVFFIDLKKVTICGGISQILINKKNNNDMTV
jgi:hypothetical protein